MATADVLQPSATPAAPNVLPLTAEKTKPKKHNVETTLYYFPNDGTTPQPTYVGKPETYLRPTEPVNVTVNDISGDEDKYTLDSHGFQIYKYESREKEFLDEDKIKSVYYEDIEDLLKKATGASKVFIFDHTIRRNPVDNRAQAVPLRGPVRRVHIDQSYKASKERVFYHLPEEADELVKKRFQLINVWRPIKQILKDPLAVADAHSVEEGDLLPAALIYPNRAGETLAVKANPKHKWYFKYGLKPEEVTLIKCFDSWDNGVARRIPHTAFTDPAEEDKYPRESIEVRTLVFYDE